ncbi:MAG: hypothetical protein A4E66_02272 [Syntrophus sp. PtaB.Bin001]|nr:MAG: hypothetical protein A4E66_02272 [Syntrophus sp. PtaB.Bin001]
MHNPLNLLLNNDLQRFGGREISFFFRPNNQIKYKFVPSAFSIIAVLIHHHHGPDLTRCETLCMNNRHNCAGYAFCPTFHQTFKPDIRSFSPPFLLDRLHSVMLLTTYFCSNSRFQGAISLDASLSGNAKRDNSSSGAKMIFILSSYQARHAESHFE